jgi:hypothetical protein
MALLSFADSVQRAYRLKAGNDLRISTSFGLLPASGIGFIGTKGADEPYARCHPIHGCAGNMAINTAIITTPEAAVKAQAEVKRKWSVAKALAKDGDITGARFELAEAADLDRAAAAILDPRLAMFCLTRLSQGAAGNWWCRRKRT